MAKQKRCCIYNMTKSGNSLHIRLADDDLLRIRLNNGETHFIEIPNNDVRELILNLLTGGQNESK